VTKSKETQAAEVADVVDSRGVPVRPGFPAKAAKGDRVGIVRSVTDGVATLTDVRSYGQFEAKAETLRVSRSVSSKVGTFLAEEKAQQGMTPGEIKESLKELGESIREAQTHAKSAGRGPRLKSIAPCCCGCGRETQSRFAPGHDARFKGIVLQHLGLDEEDRDAETADRIAQGFEALRERGDLSTFFQDLEARLHSE
jgi:hypothetical protein